MTGDGGDHAGFAAPPTLIFRRMPVPAAREIGLLRLFGIKHEEAQFVGQAVHPGAGREIIGGLGAAMQHDLMSNSHPFTDDKRHIRISMQDSAVLDI